MMEANIREDGAIALTPDSETEGWAMTQWALANAGSKFMFSFMRTLDGPALVWRPVSIDDTLTSMGFTIRGEELE